MSFTRTSIYRGPAIIQFGSCTFRSKGPINIDLTIETFDVEVANFTTADKRVKSVYHDISFTPDGTFTTGNIAALFPFQSMAIGASVFGATNTPLTLWTTDGQKRVYTTAAVSQMPNLTFSGDKTIFGPAKIRCINAPSAGWAAANSLYTASTASYPGDADFNVTQIVTAPATCTWGSTSPWASFGTKDGVTVEFALTLNNEENDALGFFDYTYKNLQVTATLTPEGPEPEDIATALVMQGTGAVRGRSVVSNGQEFTATGTGFAFTIPMAGITAGKENYDAAARRVQPVKFWAAPTFTTGAIQPLFTLAT